MAELKLSKATVGVCTLHLHVDNAEDRTRLAKLGLFAAAAGAPSPPEEMLGIEIIMTFDSLEKLQYFMRDHALILTDTGALLGREVIDEP